MKIMLVLHRLHPNLRGVIHTFEKFGIEAVFVVSSVGPSEPKTVQPHLLLNPATVTKSEIRNLLQDAMPTILVQRNFDHRFVNFWFEAKDLGVQAVRYDQYPLMYSFQGILSSPKKHISFFLRTLYFRTKLGPHFRVTPVRQWGVKARRKVRNSFYLPFPVASSPYITLEQPSTDFIRVLCVAKHGQQRKRVKWLIWALYRSGQRVQLDLVGSSPGSARQMKYHRSVERLASKTRSNHFVIQFHSDLDENEVDGLYQSAQLFVLPSRSEPIAISPLEAMAHSLPAIVASDSGSLGYVIDVNPKQVFRALSYRDFQDTLFGFLFHPRVCASVGYAARQRAKTHHSPYLFHRRIRLLLSEV